MKAASIAAFLMRVLKWFTFNKTCCNKRFKNRL